MQTNLKQMKKIGFQFLTDVQLDQYGLLKINDNDAKNQVYAIYINDKLVYIGKTKRWRKRWDTYRNAINWVSGNSSNVKKTSLITEAIKQGYDIKVYYKQAIFQHSFKDFDNNELIVQTLLEEEKRMIKKFKPEWNIQHATN